MKMAKMVVMIMVMSLVFCGNCSATDATFAWSPNTEVNLAGYKIYYGESSRSYTSSVNVGLPATVDGRVTATLSVEPGKTYYFAATAYDTDDFESDYSTEVVWTVPITDSDGDGIPDADEIASGTDPNLADTDGDGLSDSQEVTIGTSPILSDSDNDGINDGAEASLGTDPMLQDTDGDGIWDNDEVRLGYNPLVPEDLYGRNVYFDGEDGTVKEWTAINTSVILENFYDGANHWMHFKGLLSTDWALVWTGSNNSQFTISWRQFIPGVYTHQLICDAKNRVTGEVKRRTFRYQGRDDSFVYKYDPLIGLGLNTIGSDVFVTRNLQDDLHSFFPDEDVIYVYKMFIIALEAYVDDVSLSSQQTVYFDGGNGLTTAWSLVVGSGTIEIYNDPEENNNWVELTGTDSDATFLILTGSNNSQFTLQWRQIAHADYSILVFVETTLGRMNIWYYGKDADMLYNGEPLLALGSGTKDGMPHTITRNLQDDFEQFFPGQKVTAVYKVFVKTGVGSVKIDDLSLK